MQGVEFRQRETCKGLGEVEGAGKGCRVDGVVLKGREKEREGEKASRQRRAMV